MDKIVAFIPAKGTSERIKNKNLTVLDGEYLFKRKIRQLLDCQEIDVVYLDSESDLIAELADDMPVTFLRRPESLASNDTDGHEMFAWECGQVEADIYIQVLCTAPFVDSETITRALAALREHPECDSLVGVVSGKQYTWGDGEPSYGRGRIPNSVDLDAVTIETMSLYIVKAGAGPITQRFGKNPLLFELSPVENVDVNWPEDLALAETIAAGKRAQENLRRQALMPYLSSAMLSDITRELGLNCTLPQNLKSAHKGKIFGEAKTLKLSEPVEGETWEGIYDALDSYEFVRPGDVVVVENEVPEYAYFGNLNGQLAIRAGAVGVIVDGVTRDSDEVAALNLPVFSRGHYCKDIKFKGVMRSMNKPIQIGGVDIEPGSIIFGDSDGLVAISSKDWLKVREEAQKVIDKEWQIGRAVALGVEPRSIFNEFGEF